MPVACPSEEELLAVHLGGGARDGLVPALAGAAGCGWKGF
jgi:hypothetical protein